jgi:ankyrin repeat protein
MVRRQGFFLCIFALFAAATSGFAAGDVRIVNAVKGRDMAAMRALLKQRVDVNASDVEGMTALHWAAHWDDLDAVKLLLSARADAKAANRYGVTPLHEAATVGNAGIRPECAVSKVRLAGAGHQTHVVCGFD